MQSALVRQRPRIEHKLRLAAKRAAIANCSIVYTCARVGELIEKKRSLVGGPVSLSPRLRARSEQLLNPSR